MRRFFAVALLAAPALAADFHRHNFWVDLGGARPGGDLKPVFSDSFVLGFGYGYRLHEYFQAEAGLDTVFGAAGVREFLPSFVGDLRIRDYQWLLPMGGRVIVPLGSERVLFSAGGGGVYMRYGERLRQPFQYSTIRFECPVCLSRDGWGYYGLVGANVALDRAAHFRVGVTSRVYRGKTDGEPLGALPAVRTRDRWVNVAGEFAVSF
ncbi:MAG: hypothetical protein HYZ57_07950 [Acidobacteria bacterium]|nr:hypothetical protein [Acidobacteriota bacterium]MBI3279756.1 hypothetical protein [Acidobacteriota bacterium]